MRVDIIIAIYLYSNFRGYFGSQGWWLCFIIVPSIYLLTEMVCICMLMAYLLLWLRSKHRSLDLHQGVVVQGVVGRGFRFRFTRFISCHKLCRYNNEQTTFHGHFTLDAHASRPVACFISYVSCFPNLCFLFHNYMFNQLSANICILFSF